MSVFQSWWKPSLRVRMLIERGAVEAAKPMRVSGEVPGHPVEDHAEARHVAGIDECAELVWPCPWRIVGAKSPIGW